MIFTLEALAAQHGDSLLLHYGDAEKPHLALIDGGPSGVWRETLRPRLETIREQHGDAPLPIRLVMVSHIDDDHINGVLALFEDMAQRSADGEKLPYRITTLWHNSFDDYVSTLDGQAATVLDALSEQTRAVIASVDQGRRLRQAAASLGIQANAPIGALIVSRGDGRDEVDMGGGLRFQVLGPLQAQLDALRKEWDKKVAALLKTEAKDRARARAALFADKSVANLSSLVVVARAGNSTVLLTGDARGDHVVEALKSSGLLAARGKVHFDVLKVPHHGSNRNVTTDFFRRVTADHYVISANGRHRNPDRDTLEMIAEARGRAPYTIWFTFPADAHLHEKDPERKEALEGVADWAAVAPSNARLVFRETDASSISIHLGGRRPA